jgi:predicted O-methyltransferase YrrM
MGAVMLLLIIAFCLRSLAKSGEQRLEEAETVVEAGSAWGFGTLMMCLAVLALILAVIHFGGIVAPLPK